MRGKESERDRGSERERERERAVRRQQLTRVGHELKGSAELPIAGSGASADVEDVGGDGRQALDVGVPWRGLYDPVAPLVLVLLTEQRGHEGKEKE